MKCSFCKLDKNELTLYSHDSHICSDCQKSGEFLVKTSEGNILGPYSEKELNNIIENKIIVLLDEVSLNGSEWLFVKDIELFKQALQNSSYELDEKTMNVSTSVIKKDELPPVFADHNISTSKQEKTKETTNIKEIFGDDFFGEKQETATVPKNHFWKNLFVSLGFVSLIIIGIFIYDNIKTVNLDDSGSKRIINSNFSLNDYLLKAKEYKDDGLFKEADRFYLKALDLSPSSIPALLYHAGINLVLNNDINSAQSVLSELSTKINMGQIVDKSLKTDTNLFLGLLYVKTKDFVTAKEYFKRVLNINPANIDASFNLGILAFIAKDYDDAISYFDNILQIDANNIETMIYKGLIYLLQAKNKEAITVLENLILKYPYGSMPYIFTAYAWYKLDNIAEVKNMIDKVTNLEPFFTSKLSKNIMHLDLEEKLVSYEKDFLNEVGKLKVLKDTPGITIAKAFVLTEKKSYKEAKILITNALKTFKEEPLLFASLGMLFYQEGNDKVAMHYIEKALILDYSNSLAHLYAALISLKDKNTLTQALNHGIKAYTSNNTFLCALMLQGDVYYRFEQTSEAMLIWKKVLSLEPRYYMAQYRLKLKRLLYQKRI